MNREILFKAKRKDNGEWIQGYYYQIWQQGYILWGMINNIRIGILEKNEGQ